MADQRPALQQFQCWRLESTSVNRGPRDKGSRAPCSCTRTHMDTARTRVSFSTYWRGTSDWVPFAVMYGCLRMARRSASRCQRRMPAIAAGRPRPPQLAYMDPSSVASTPFFGFEIRLLTYIRPLPAASSYRCRAI